MVSSKDERIVDEVYRDIQRINFPEWPNIYIADKVLRNRLIQLFKKENVTYIIRKLDAEGHEYILWDPLCDLKARELIEGVSK